MGELKTDISKWKVKDPNSETKLGMDNRFDKNSNKKVRFN